MNRVWLSVAALLGFFGVGAGAVGAHVVSDPARVGLVVTATSFALPHAAALVGLALLASRTGRGAGRRFIEAGGWCIAAGTVLFSAALWSHGLLGVALGPVAPTGGILLMLGWLLLLPGVWLSPQS